jgi:hypothetical protein
MSSGATKRFPRAVRDRRMARTLRQNSGLITRSGLRELGFSHPEIVGLVDHGDLRRLYRGVYADGRAPISDHAHLKASLLVFGNRSWLSGQAAAMGWKFEAVSLPRLEVTVVADATPRQRPGLVVRSVRRAPHPSEIRFCNGLRLSSIPRLLIETAAAGASSDQLQRLIEQAVGRNLLDVPELAATLERNLGQRGIVAVRRTCEGYLPHTDRKSGLERVFDRWLIGHPEIPAPQRNIRLGPWEIDCYWPRQHLAVELDGRPYHTVVEEIDRDRRKDTWLQLRGDRILRITDSRFKRDKPGVHRDLTAMLALGLAGASEQLAA